jgi:hypothetical protein
MKKHAESLLFYNERRLVEINLFMDCCEPEDEKWLGSLRSKKVESEAHLVAQPQIISEQVQKIAELKRLVARFEAKYKTK